MKILHVCYWDVSGGAARATYRLHRGLRKLGYESSMYVRYRRSDDATVKVFPASMDLFSRLRRRVRRATIARAFERYRETRPSGYEIFSDDRSEYGSDLVKHLPESHVVNLHWVAGFVDHEAFFSAVPKQAPVVWRLCDMNPLTGGCHFAEGCGKYLQGCGGCPQLGSHDPDDLSHAIWMRKSRIFNAVDPSKLHFVALNRWMAGEVKKVQFLQKFPVTIIPNGIDAQTFAPRDRRFAREMLDLPVDRSIILFAAVNADLRRKGIQLLAQALAGLEEGSAPLLVSVGYGKPELKVSISHVHLGFVDDDRLLALLYSAADVYVVPSLWDNSPNTVLESMACGTPVVGFSVAGIAEMVRHGETGLLAPPGDISALRAGIRTLLRNPGLRAEMGYNCRRIAIEEYSSETQARRYSELYQSLLRADR